MASITYEDLVLRLTPDAKKLFTEMVSEHLAAGQGDRLFIRSDTMSGTGMIFTGQGRRQDWRNFDGAALNDLVGYGLLHPGFGGRGTPNYRVSGEGLHFYRWLMNREGEAVTQVDEYVQRALSGDSFAKRHAGAAHHLREAFDLIWRGGLTEQVISEVGDHLRKALMDTVTDLVGDSTAGEQEKPVERLKQWLAEGSNVTRRDADVVGQLVELARAVLRLDHRLNHVRDEADKGERAPTADEVRRAAFTTAFVCHELDAVSS